MKRTTKLRLLYLHSCEGWHRVILYKTRPSQDIGYETSWGSSLRSLLHFFVLKSDWDAHVNSSCDGDSQIWISSWRGSSLWTTNWWLKFEIIPQSSVTEPVLIESANFVPTEYSLVNTFQFKALTSKFCTSKSNIPRWWFLHFAAST